MNYLLLFASLLVFSCQERQKRIDQDCFYNISKHEKLISDSTIYKEYTDSLFVIFDERVNNVGFVYYFRKYDSLFNDCIFFNSNSTYRLSEAYNFAKNKHEIDGSLIYAHSYTKEVNGVNIIVNYHLMNRAIRNAIFKKDEDSTKVKIRKNSLRTNSHYSIVFLEGVKEKDLAKSEMYFMADFIECDGTVNKVRERIAFK